MLTVVVVTFNSARVIAACLGSIPAAARVIVIDNASRDDTVGIAGAVRPTAHIRRLPENCGFGTAANLGLAEAATPLALLLNADARLRPGALEALAAAGERYQEAGLLAPSSWDPAGRLQFGRQPLFGAWCRGGEDAAAVPAGDCCAPYLPGSALCFRLQAFRAIGGFDERIFLYFEDDDICLRLTKGGWSLVHVADAHIDHLAGRSTDGVPRLEYWKHWHRRWSRLHMEEKHRGRSSALALALAELPRLWLKAAAYRIIGHREKHGRYAARCGGTWAYLSGRQARHVGLG